MAKLCVVNITKRFREITALKNVSFEVYKGEYIAILGPTGAGKTTLLRIIAGLLRPDEGSIIIDGKDVTDLTPEERNIGYMPQGYSLFPHMTVFENVAYGLYLKGLSEKEINKKVSNVLKLVGLYHRRDSYPHELSGGMRQRVALARAIVQDSEIILLDEPLSALDLLLNIELRHELRRIAKKLKLTVLHVTHNHEEALAIADRVLVLNKGRVEQYDTPENIYKKPKSIFVAYFIGDANILKGTVLSNKNGDLIVDVEGICTLRVKGDYFYEGQRVVLVFRPEVIKLTKERVNKDNLIEGIIKRKYFIGMFTFFDIEINDTLIRACELSRKSMYFNEGDKVYVHFPPEEGLIYEYPREGLVKVLEM